MITTLLTSSSSLLLLAGGGDGPSGPVDHSHDLRNLAIAFGVFGAVVLLCWLGFRYEKSQDWDDEGGN